MEQNKTGTNKLADRILADARAIADRAMMEANMKAMEISANGVERCGDLRRESRRKRELAVQNVLDGCKTRASIDGRKAALQKKRVVIDEVFAQTYDALCAMEPADRAEICKKILLSEAENGETVVPSAADRAAIVRILADSNREDLSVADYDAPIDGGFLLVGKSYEKDCSFRSVLEQIRVSEETAVANLLFD